MDVSVIIVSYNTATLIRNCVYSVLEKTNGVEYEIIVVDNNSTDNSVVVLNENFAHNSNFKLLELNENLGFGKANNKGLAVARGRNVFLLNPDTILLNNAVKMLSDYLDSNEKVGVCGGNLFDGDMKPAHSFCRQLPGVMSEINSLTFGYLYKILYGKNRDFNYKKKEMSVGYITGADMMVRKKVLDEVGCFNPAFFMYYEETELTFRIKRAGYDIRSIPNAEIQHLEGQSFGEFKERRERMFLEGRDVYNTLVGSRAKQIIIDFLFVLNINVRILIHTFIKKKHLSFWKKKSQLYKEMY